MNIDLNFLFLNISLSPFYSHINQYYNLFQLFKTNHYPTNTLCQRSITRTLFPITDKTYSILVCLAKTYHFDTILLLIYTVTKLGVPKSISLAKGCMHYSFLSKFKIFVINLVYRFNIYYKRGMRIIVSL